MIFHLVKFKEEHGRAILRRNAVDMQVPEDEIIRNYQIPGSVAFTILARETPIACMGIINLGWSNGEAWLLTSDDFKKHAKTGYSYVKKTFPIAVEMGGFKRVQAHCFDQKCNLFKPKHLNFEVEAPCMKSFGPSGESAILYAKTYPEGK